ARPARTASRVASAATTPEHRRAPGHERGRRGPAPFSCRSWNELLCAGYPMALGVPSTVAVWPKTSTSATCHSLAVRLELQSALLFGSWSWSPWYDACPVHWLLATTSFRCVARPGWSAAKYRSVRSGAAARGVTAGNASAGADTSGVQPVATDPSQVWLPGVFPARQTYAVKDRSAVKRFVFGTSCAETPSRFTLEPFGPTPPSRITIPRPATGAPVWPSIVPSSSSVTFTRFVFAPSVSPV